MSTLPEAVNTAIIPVPKLEEDRYDWWERHERILNGQAGINPEVVLIGDSITHFWGGEPRTEGMVEAESWHSAFGPYRVLNMGFGWDRIQNVLWRLDHGEMEGLSPRTVIVLIGTNNTSETPNARANTPVEAAEGLRAICDRIEARAPDAKIVIMAVLPLEREPDNPRRQLIAGINEHYKRLADERHYDFVDIGPSLLEADGTLSAETAPDFCHLSESGYRRWGEAIRPLLAAHAHSAR